MTTDALSLEVVEALPLEVVELLDLVAVVVQVAAWNLHLGLELPDIGAQVPAVKEGQTGDASAQEALKRKERGLKWPLYLYSQEQQGPLPPFPSLPCPPSEPRCLVTSSAGRARPSP